jgi:hypothetical protein
MLGGTKDVELKLSSAGLMRETWWCCAAKEPRWACRKLAPRRHDGSSMDPPITASAPEQQQDLREPAYTAWKVDCAIRITVDQE